MTELLPDRRERLPGPNDQKSRSPLYAFLGALLVASAGMAVAFAFTAGVGVALAGTGATVSRETSFVLTLLTGGLGFVTAAVAYQRYRGMDPLSYVGVSLPSLGDLTWAVGGYLGAMALVTLSGIVLTAFQVNPDTANRAAEAGMQTPSLLLWLVPLSFLVIAPAEEYLFRGTVQRRLREALPAWAAIPLTAVVFATFHFFSLTGGAGGRFVAIGVLFLPSLVFGVVYEYTGNVVSSMLVHGAYNSTLVLLLYASLSMGNPPVPGLL